MSRAVSQGEEELPKAIILDLADHLFLLTGTADASDAVKTEAKDKALELIKEHSAPTPPPLFACPGVSVL